jgi:hypothetical protein
VLDALRNKSFVCFSTFEPIIPSYYFLLSKKTTTKSISSDDLTSATASLLLSDLRSHTQTTHTAPARMAPPNTRALANWAVERATALSEVWALVAKHRGVLGARRLMRVCRDSRAGATEYLRTLPGLVVCGGYTQGVGTRVREVWRLNVATLRWEPMPALVTARSLHACCAVRGTLVVLGGDTAGDGFASSSVKMLSSPLEEGAAFVELPRLSCGGIRGASAIAVEESDSAAGQVLLLGGSMAVGEVSSTVHLVDLATGACAPQNDLLHPRYLQAAGRLADGRVVCAGGIGSWESAEVWGPPEQGAPDAPWTWINLPAMSAGRIGHCGCVMSDGRFAVLGGMSNGVTTSSCEALVIDDSDANWAPMPPMHDARRFFACGAVAGCVIVAGGVGLKSSEMYDAELNRWLRLPCDLPYEGSLADMGSAVL